MRKKLIKRCENGDNLPEASIKSIDMNFDPLPVEPTKAKGFGDKFNDFYNNNLSKFTPAANIVNGLNIRTPQEKGLKGNITTGLNGAYDTIQNIAGNIPVYGKAIQGAMALNKAAGKLVANIGGGTDGMTTGDAVLGSAFFQMSPIGLLNGFGGSRSHELNDLSDQTNLLYGDKVMSGFSGTGQGVADTMKYSNKKYGLFSSGSRKKANRAIDKLNYQQDQIQDIAAASQNAFDIQSSMSSVNEAATAFDLQGGYKQGSVQVGKEGLKFDTVFGRNRKFEGIPIHKEGGQMNVIPEGALHARKHNMEDSDNLTQKGIPVVDNNGEQQAEIELNEIIFNKEVTEKLERYYKIFNNDKFSEKEKEEAAIEAGKLLSIEILENTDDRTGLIETI